mgnify:FL=1
MINKEFLANCSDEQIEFGVAWIDAKKLDIKYRLFLAIEQVNEGIIVGGHYYNPCHNPNEIMPIAFANRISIEIADNDDEWIATHGTSYDHSYYYPVRNWEHESVNANPLRAICEVYILMSVSK